MRTMVFRSLVPCGLLVASILVALFVCEASLRIFDVSYPIFDDYDATRGFRLRPGKQGWYRAEGEAYLSINSLGYRDREHDPRKPEDVFRIAVLGDSFVEARQVSLEDTFWNRLGDHLWTCPLLADKRIEMLNFGIGGYNTSQEYMTLQQDVRIFSPDMILLAMFPGNDIEGNSTRLQESSAWRLAAPTHTLVNGELVLDDSFDRSVWRRVLYEMVHRSRVFELMNEVRRTIRAWTWQSADPDNFELGLSAHVYVPPASMQWQEAWRVTEALLAKMDDLARHMGARFVVTTIPDAIQVDPNGDRRGQFEARLGADDLLYPDERIARMGSELGFRVYPLTRELQEITETQKVYMHGFDNTRLGFGHMNEQGHRLVAELLASKLCNSTDLGIADRQMVESRAER